MFVPPVALNDAEHDAGEVELAPKPGIRHGSQYSFEANHTLARKNPSEMLVRKGLIGSDFNAKKTVASSPKWAPTKVNSTGCGLNWSCLRARLRHRCVSTTMS